VVGSLLWDIASYFSDGSLKLSLATHLEHSSRMTMKHIIISFILFSGVSRKLPSYNFLLFVWFVNTAYFQ